MKREPVSHANDACATCGAAIREDWRVLVGNRRRPHTLRNCFSVLLAKVLEMRSEINDGTWRLYTELGKLRDEMHRFAGSTTTSDGEHHAPEGQ